MRGAAVRAVLTVADRASPALALSRVFFNVVAALCLVLAFFASWMSFSANVSENSREFGVLRALGLNYWQVVRVYIYEAMAVVLSSFFLGTIVGAFPTLRPYAVRIVMPLSAHPARDRGANASMHQACASRFPSRYSSTCSPRCPSTSPFRCRCSSLRW